MPSTPERCLEKEGGSREKFMSARMKYRGSPGKGAGGSMGSALKIERSRGEREFKKSGG